MIAEQLIYTDIAEHAGQPIAASDIVINVRSVSKMYRIHERPQDRLKQIFALGRRRYGREFWALHDISFEVRRGETIGIIGRNGSGKSTLLEIIAGTLTPTKGKVDVSGRVAALLELGSGFNPEFTGRENVLLNGAILGIEPEEMEDRFDNIAAFADIGNFIDQPIKTYSSGMLVRLAFAVQAHLEPDVLIVDEALSVGDVHFQHKCMRRIKELVDRGTTLLFVSHSTETVKRFCRTALWLDAGETRYYGEAGVTVEKYLAFMRMREVQDWVAAGGDSTTPAAPPALDEVSTPYQERRVSPHQQRMVNQELLLPSVAYEIDLSEERLFLRGHWEWASLPGALAQARYSDDPNAVAGFRCNGSQIELAFLSRSHSGTARVTIDGSERQIDLSLSNEQRIQKTRLEVGAGEHTVLISPVKQEFGPGGGLWWLGGHVLMSPQLVFRQDQDFGLQGTVERYGSGKARLTAVELLDYTSEQPVTEVMFGQRVRLRLHAERLQPAGPRLEFSYIVRDRNRIDLFGTTTTDEHVRLDPNATCFVVEFAFTIQLGPGSYSILAAFVECSEDLSYKLPLDCVDLACVFTVNFDTSRPVWYLFHEPVAVQALVE